MGLGGYVEPNGAQLPQHGPDIPAAGPAKKAADQRRRADTIAAEVNLWMWDERDQLYYDVNDKGSLIRWKTIASFWPMLSGISGPEQNEMMARHLFDTASFWRKTPFPSLAADMPYYHPMGRYWQGGVWAPCNYMVIKGLENAGFDSLAHVASLKYLHSIYQVYASSRTLWECYAPDSLSPAYGEYTDQWVHRDFAGWTALAPISLFIENIIGINVRVPEKKICWSPRSTKRAGIKNLALGNKRVSLIYHPETDLLEIDTDAQGYELYLSKRNGAKHKLALLSGRYDLRTL
ncbi:MAG: hypothetical protein HC842_00820 [Cytophagales bacterium]|nr:hypothetical protein [Cytophagales bacterium]